MLFDREEDELVVDKSNREEKTECVNEEMNVTLFVC